MVEYKYNEDTILQELAKYIDETYSQHYSHGKYQATEFIIDAGFGEGFCLGNIMKYAQRYGKKEGKNKKDLFKIIHYAMMAISTLAKEQQGEDNSRLTPPPAKPVALTIDELLAKGDFGKPFNLTYGV